MRFLISASFWFRDFKIDFSQGVRDFTECPTPRYNFSVKAYGKSICHFVLQRQEIRLFVY